MWKTFAGRCIHQASPSITVHQNFFYRWLLFDKRHLQSLILRSHPQTPALSYIPAFTLAAKEAPGPCCLLGLGGAGVAHALNPFVPRMVAVENNEVIIRIANTYFHTHTLKQLDIVHEAAEVFVEDCQIRFAHVMVDLFAHNAFPLSCNTPEFFKHCKRLLLPNGILAVNLTHLEEEWSVFAHIQHHFQGKTVLLPVKGAANVIVLCCNAASLTPLLNLLKESTCLKKLHWDKDWGCIAELKGL